MAEEIEVVQSVMTVSSCVYAHGFSGLPVLSADVDLLKRDWSAALDALVTESQLISVKASQHDSSVPGIYKLKGVVIKPLRSEVIMGKTMTSWRFHGSLPARFCFSTEAENFPFLSLECQQRGNAAETKQNNTGAVQTQTCRTRSR